MNTETDINGAQMSSLFMDETVKRPKRGRAYTQTLLNMARTAVRKTINAKEKYIVELLPEEEQTHTVYFSGGRTAVVRTRCSSCGGFATKVEKYAFDSTYRRELCDYCAAKGK